MRNITLPSDLVSIIGSEQVDFSIYARRNQPAKNALSIIIFALVWSALPVIGSIAFFGPLLKGEEVHFTSNDVPVAASWENLEPMLIPSLLLGLFLLIGFGMLLWGVLSLFKKGGYFVGTSSRLIRYQNGKINTYGWDQFLINMEIDTLKGYLCLQLKTGKQETSDKRETLYLAGISDVLKIEQFCRQRITELNPAHRTNE